MNRILLFCALGALFGCRQATAPSGEAITLCYSTSEQSKTDALTEGDEVTVFARIDGTEHYFLEGVQYVVGADGHSLTYGSTVYYPETKQAINFYAYFGGAWDEGQGTCSVPSDQSTPAALKQADLCWASASSTPVPTPVSLTFQHLLARLLVTANQAPSKISLPNVQPSGVLNAATAQFVLGSDRKEVWTTGTELIMPVQPLSRLVLTVSGIEYVFDGSINLQSGQTTTINLTLNPSTKTATLNGSSTTAWTASNQNGTPTQTASNVLTIHWPKCHSQSPSVDKVVLTVKDHSTNTTVGCIVSSGITYANQQFVVPVESNQVHYPYTIVDVALYRSDEWLHRSMNIVGATITKRGACVVGVQQPLNPPTVSDYVELGGLRWAKGNLVAKSAFECKIGGYLDCGLYIRFGSLIGWGGGVNGDGTGSSTTSISGKAVVKPLAHTATPIWSNITLSTGNTSFSEGYFTYSSTHNGVNYAANGTTYADYPGMMEGDFADKGIGDACRYYLGAPWRLPTSVDYVTLFGVGIYNGTLPMGAWAFQTTPPTCLYRHNPQLLFVAAGATRNPNGGFTTNIPPYWCLLMTNTIYSDSHFAGAYGSWGGATLTYLNTNTALTRDGATPVRCVADI